MSELKLKPCPFCGETPTMEDMEQMPCPQCRNCGCIFEFYKEDYTEKEIEKLFNNRPKENALRARIDSLEKEVAPFRASYFTGLSMEAIAELAKKSIRLTDQHNKDTARIEELEGALGEVLYYIGESDGISGYHKNGNIATWEELELESLINNALKGARK